MLFAARAAHADLGMLQGSLSGTLLSSPARPSLKAPELSRPQRKQQLPCRRTAALRSSRPVTTPQGMPFVGLQALMACRKAPGHYSKHRQHLSNNQAVPTTASIYWGIQVHTVLLRQSVVCLVIVSVFAGGPAQRHRRRPRAPPRGAAQARTALLWLSRGSATARAAPAQRSSRPSWRRLTPWGRQGRQQGKLPR